MRPSAKRIAEIIHGFSTARVAVVGDFVADVYLEAEPVRLSREAPVLVATWRGETMIPGGAANSVNNLLALGASVHPVGVLGDDPHGDRLRGFFSGERRDDRGIVVQPGFGTVSKTRVMLGEEGRMRQQVLRLDREPGGRIDEGVRRALFGRLAEALPRIDAVLFSDYGYGTIDESMVQAAVSARPRVVVTADSRYRLAAFRGVDIVTPNCGEAAETTGLRVKTETECAEAGRAIRSLLGIDQVVITRGNLGMMLLEGAEAPRFIPASGAENEVTDVSGAGDTVIALATLARVAGATWAEASWLANVGAGVVVTKMGAATVSPEELIRAATREP